MLTATRTFRVFVSSTFADLKAERNALQERVFPELQRLCEANGCRFQAIDLRWGVSEEAALDQQTMNICLTELRRCQDVSPRPNFIILLGDRYGWIPLPPQIESAEFEEILVQVDKEDRRLLAWDEARPDGGGGWYRRDTNAVPPEYVLRPRREQVPEEADRQAWGRTEDRLRAALLSAIDGLAWAPDDPRRVKYECSATHQEIDEGALRLPDEREHVFAFLRNIRNLEDLAPECEHVDAGRDRARALKEQISRTPGVTTFSYDVAWDERGLEVERRAPEQSQEGSVAERGIVSHAHVYLDRFAADALNALRCVIEEEIGQLQKIDDLARENAAHEEFGAERRRHFVGRQGILGSVASYLRADRLAPLVVHGPSGSGKSAVMAMAAREAAEAHGQAQIIQRFIGATPESTDIRTLLRNLCLEISHEFGFDALKEQELAEAAAFAAPPDGREAIPSPLMVDEMYEKKYAVPEEYNHLSERFREFLGMIPDDRRLLLFLDALGQLGAADNAYSLNWLPSKLAPNVRIVVSVLERDDEAGQCLKSARLKVPPENLLPLGDMTPNEGEQALRAWFIEVYPERKRALTDEQMQSVISGFQGCPRPLYLRLAFEEARRWKSFDGLPCGADKAPGLAGDIPGIVGDMLARLRDRRHHGEVLVGSFLGLLSASRHGLSETEVLELLSEDEAVMADLRSRSARSPEAKGIPAVVWLRLYHDLAPYPIERSADNSRLLAFYHRQVGETVAVSYLRLQDHIQLAHYFGSEKRPLWFGEGATRRPNHRRCAELPYQQTRGEMWPEVEATLTDLHFIEAKVTAGLTFDLGSDYRLVLDSLPEAQEEKKKRQAHEARVQKYIRDLIAYAKGEIKTLDIIPSVEPWSNERIEEECRRIRENPTRQDRLQAFSDFVASETYPLLHFGTHPGFVIQHAENRKPGDPVQEAASKLVNTVGVPLLLRRWPAATKWDPKCALQRTLEGLSKPVTSVSVSADDRSAVLVTRDGVRRWDLYHGQLDPLCEGSTNGSGRISITPDGQLAVLSDHSFDDAVVLLDLPSRKPLGRLDHYSNRVYCTDLTPDGRTAVTGGSDKAVRLWDLREGRCIRILSGHRDTVSCIGITPDGQAAVSGSYDGTLLIWNLESGGRPRQLGGHAGVVISVHVVGGRLVSAGLDNTIRTWDFDSGLCHRTIDVAAMSGFSISADGKLGVSIGRVGPIRLWDLAEGTCLREIADVQSGVSCVSITPDGRQAVCGYGDGTARLWNLENGSDSSLGRPMVSGHSDMVRGLSEVSCRRVLTWSVDETMLVWATDAGRALQRIGVPCASREHRGLELNNVSVSLGGRRIVSLGFAGRQRIWDLVSGACLRTIEAHGGEAVSLQVSQDGRKAVVQHVDKTLRLWDLESGACADVRDSEGERALVFGGFLGGRRGSHLLTANDRSLIISNTEDGKCIRAIHLEKALIVRVAALPESNHAAVFGRDEQGNVLWTWDLDTGNCLRSYSFPIDVGGLRCAGARFQPSTQWYFPVGEKRAVIHTRYGDIALFDLDGGEVLARSGGVWSVTIVGNRYALSAGVDKTVRVWDVYSGTCEAILFAESQANYLALVECGRAFAVGTSNGTILVADILNLDSHMPTRSALPGSEDGAYEQLLRRGLDFSRRERGPAHEETLAHLTALAMHLVLLPVKGGPTPCR